jgi:dihydrofolate synthase/folylpolyglutamate synthase
VVVGKKQAESSLVIEKVADENQAPICYAEEHFELREVKTRKRDKLTYDVWYDHQAYIEKLESPLLGRYQGSNIATAFQTLELLNKAGQIKFSQEDIRSGIANVIENTGLQGRWQILATNPLTICDTAHNPEGIQAIVDQIADTQFEHLHFVFGMVNDKNPESILFLLPKNATYYFCKPDIPRGMEAEELKNLAFKAGLRGEAYNSVTNAYNSAMNNAGVNDLLFIGGSTFVVAEVV